MSDASWFFVCSQAEQFEAVLEGQSGLNLKSWEIVVKRVLILIITFQNSCFYYRILHK